MVSYRSNKSRTLLINESFGESKIILRASNRQLVAILKTHLILLLESFELPIKLNVPIDMPGIGLVWPALNLMLDFKAFIVFL